MFASSKPVPVRWAASRGGAIAEFAVASAIRDVRVRTFGSLNISLIRFVEWIGGAMVGETIFRHRRAGARCIVAIANGRLFFAQYGSASLGEVIFS